MIKHTDAVSESNTIIAWYGSYFTLQHDKLHCVYIYNDEVDISQINFMQALLPTRIVVVHCVIFNFQSALEKVTSTWNQVESDNAKLYLWISLKLRSS